MDEEVIPLSQTFMEILGLLHLKLTLASPSMHLSTLHSHFQTVLRESATLPKDLLARLRTVSSRSHIISRTATSLSDMLSHLKILQNLPTPPTACALIILATEAEISSSLPHAGVFAQVLGSRMGVSQKVIMERYKIIYDAVEVLIHEVPWLERHEKRSGRSKIAKRSVVARGLKDVVQFQEQIWFQQMERLAKPTLVLETDEDEIQHDSRSDTPIVMQNCSVPTVDLHKDSYRSQSDTVKPRTRHQRVVGAASRFLLNPTSRKSATCASLSLFDDDTLTQLLTVDAPSLTHVCHDAPTRLQALAYARGGEDTIHDEELFEEGELENFIRSDAEITILRDSLNWDEKEISDEIRSLPGISRKRKNLDDRSGFSCLI